jgi:hypothetical protein
VEIKSQRPLPVSLKAAKAHAQRAGESVTMTAVVTEVSAENGVSVRAESDAKVDGMAHVVTPVANVASVPNVVSAQSVRNASLPLPVNPENRVSPESPAHHSQWT